MSHYVFWINIHGQIERERFGAAFMAAHRVTELRRAGNYAVRLTAEVADTHTDDELLELLR